MSHYTAMVFLMPLYAPFREPVRRHWFVALMLFFLFRHLLISSHSSSPSRDIATFNEYRFMIDFRSYAVNKMSTYMIDHTRLSHFHCRRPSAHGASPVACYTRRARWLSRCHHAPDVQLQRASKQHISSYWLIISSLLIASRLSICSWGFVKCYSFSNTHSDAAWLLWYADAAIIWVAWRFIDIQGNLLGTPDTPDIGTVLSRFA